jgi:hypothetical protein
MHSLSLNALRLTLYGLGTAPGAADRWAPGVFDG